MRDRASERWAVAIALVVTLLLATMVARAESPASLSERAVLFLASRPGGRWRVQRERVWIHRLVTLTEVAAQTHGLRPELLLALSFREASWKARVTGRIGEHGLLQIAPTVMRRMAPGEDPYDPAVNLRVGASILALWKDDCGGDEARWVASYGHGRCADPRSADRQVVRWADRIAGP